MRQNPARLRGGDPRWIDGSPSAAVLDGEFFGVQATTLSTNVVENVSTFGSAAVSISVQLSPARVVGEQSFGAPTVARGAVALQPTRVPDADAFGAPAVSRGAVALAPTRVADADGFGAPSVSRGPVTVVPSRVPAGAAFGVAALLRGAVSLQPPGLAGTSTVGAPVVTPGVRTVQPAALLSSAGVSAPSVTNIRRRLMIGVGTFRGRSAVAAGAGVIGVVALSAERVTAQARRRPTSIVARHRVVRVTSESVAHA